MFRNRQIDYGRLVPAFLLLITLLGFGLLIPWLGFYWDDWAKILVSRLYGLGGYAAYYAEDRPLSAWTHIVFTPLLGHSPLGWHIFVLALRWLSGWAAWWCLNSLWPRARRLNLMAVLLFLVYPVFVQQPAAVTFHQQWLQYALFLFSLGAMVAAWRNPARRVRWTALAVGAMLIQFTVTEYFIPVELLRPLMLWFLAGQDPAEGPARRLGRVARAWLPYLIPLAVFTVWRLFFIRLSGEDPYRATTLYDFLAQPWATLQQTLVVASVDELRILVTSWSELLDIDIAVATPFSLFSYVVGLIAGGLAAAALLRLNGSRATDDDHLGGSPDEAGCLRQMLALGVVGVLLGPAPAWISGRQVVFDFHSDRYALPAMFGAALLLTAAAGWLVQRRLQRAVLAGVLVALAVSLHLQVANDYRWIWTAQQRTFWELAWRAPGLQPNTALFFEEEPFPNQGLFSTSAALNLLYPQPRATDPARLELDYWVYTLRPRFRSAPDSYTFGLGTQFRTLHFSGGAPDSLLVYRDPAHSNCLWVLSERDADHPYLPGLVLDFLPISNLDRILPEAVQSGYPPVELLGSEPPHNWCYYFEKADLARQMGDWQTAARLADEALELGYRPDRLGSNAVYEWLPFIEALALMGREQEASDLSRLAYETDPAYGGMLDDVWARVGLQ